MILTVTLNPSVDINYDFSDSFSLGEVNRVAVTRKTAGGKGLNVSRVLRQLQEDVTATGFLGGHLGGFIAEEVKEMNVQERFVRIEGETRNCIAIIHEGEQTEILERGPSISSEEKNQLSDVFTRELEDATYVTISGSLPEGIEDGYYNELLTSARRSGIPVLLDAKAALLEKAISHTEKPYLIKPNATEMDELMGEVLEDSESIAEVIRSTWFSEIPWVVVTLGGEGAVVKWREKVFEVKIPNVKAVNPVGSGDSVIAGFASAFERGIEGEEAMRYALAMGVSNAENSGTGEVDVQMVKNYIKKIQVEEVPQ